MTSQDPKWLRDRTPEGAINFDPQELLQGDTFCVVEGEDVVLFEGRGNGVYTGHYFFNSRGKEAIEVGRRILKYVFSGGAQVIQGLTPVENKAALWVTRRLGFKMLDVIETDLGQMQLSMLTKKDYI